MRLLIATTSSDKLREIRQLLVGVAVNLVTLAEVSPVPEPAETGVTFWENAREKALAYAQATGLLVVAEDSGLEVDTLGGEPGVRSARFLGPATSYPVRFTEIFRQLDALPSAPRSARFVTALALVRGPKVLFETEARVEGTIAAETAGANGFGYDPIFFYPPLGRTMAQMTAEEKEAVSHRGRAFRDLARFLRASVSTGALED